MRSPRAWSPCSRSKSLSPGTAVAVAVIEDTGRTIAITVAKDNLAKSLKSAIEAVAGKGEKIRSVNSGGVYPVIEYMGN